MTLLPTPKRSFRIRTTCAAAGMALTLATSAQAQETSTYTYDALGRLTNVTTFGGPSNGVNQAYGIVKANAR